MDYKDIIVAITVMGIVTGTILILLGVWEAKKSKKTSI